MAEPARARDSCLACVHHSALAAGPRVGRRRRNPGQPGRVRRRGIRRQDGLHVQRRLRPLLVPQDGRGLVGSCDFDQQRCVGIADDGYLWILGPTSASAVGFRIGIRHIRNCTARRQLHGNRVRRQIAVFLLVVVRRRRHLDQPESRPHVQLGGQLHHPPDGDRRQQRDRSRGRADNHREQRTVAPVSIRDSFAGGRRRTAAGGLRGLRRRRDQSLLLQLGFR